MAEQFDPGWYLDENGNVVRTRPYGSTPAAPPQGTLGSPPVGVRNRREVEAQIARDLIQKKQSSVDAPKPRPWTDQERMQLREDSKALDNPAPAPQPLGNVEDKIAQMVTSGNGSGAPLGQKAGVTPRTQDKPFDLEAMIAKDARHRLSERLWNSGEQGMRNAADSITTTGAAIRLGANPVPPSTPPQQTRRSSIGPLEAYSMKQRQESLDLNRRAQDRQDMEAARRQMQSKRPTWANAKGLPLMSARDQMEYISERFDAGDIQSGPATGRVQAILNSVGFQDPDTKVNISNLMNSLASFVNAKTGAQASFQEYNRLASVLPALTDNPEAFKAAVDNFIRLIDIDLQNMVDVGEGQNYDMTPYKNKIQGGMSPAPTEGQVKFRRKSDGAILKTADPKKIQELQNNPEVEPYNG